MDARSVILRRNGGPEVLRTERHRLGDRAPGKVRIEVAYSGVNWADCSMRMGLYRDAPPKPFTPGYEVSGTVLDADDDAGFKPGDRVAGGTRFGGYASHIDLDPSQLFHVPKKLGLDQAAALPVVYLTAAIALHELARIRAGEKVLVHGGAGGVGLAAIALAKQAGADVYGVAGGPEKCAFLEEEAGVSQAFDHFSGDWRDQVLAGPGKMDVILDPIGGDHLKQSLRTVGLGGKVIGFGASSIAKGKVLNPLRALKVLRQMRLSAVGFMQHNSALMGLNALYYFDERPVWMREQAEKMMADIVKGKLDGPRIAATFPLDDAASAHRFLHDRRNIGKVLLQA